MAKRTNIGFAMPSSRRRPKCHSTSLALEVPSPHALKRPRHDSEGGAAGGGAGALMRCHHPPMGPPGRARGVHKAVHSLGRKWLCHDVMMVWQLDGMM